ncbi:hypothetical protein G7046_g7473 [Stylonectria norvegica]|nr:hypothetical protein G7046_g7473 [Stylonectria norvegica]
MEGPKSFASGTAGLEFVSLTANNAHCPTRTNRLVRITTRTPYDVERSCNVWCYRSPGPFPRPSIPRLAPRDLRFSAEESLLILASSIQLGDPKATTAAIDIHESLYYLQHRGQDAAGITVSQGGRVYQAKGNGLVSKVMSDGARLQQLPGNIGIGHLRYPTSGTSSAYVTPLGLSKALYPWFREHWLIMFDILDPRPSPSMVLRRTNPAVQLAFQLTLEVNTPFGICMGVNGNLINIDELREFLDVEAHRHINSDSDSELLLNVYAHALTELGKSRVNSEDIFTALRAVYEKCKGAFACTTMIAGFGILGFRDANGIRPLCIGSRPSATLAGATDWFMASESIALTQLGFENIRDIKPGEAVFIQKGCSPIYRQVVPQKTYTPDIFEYVYFARPDTVMDGISVHLSRQNMGIELAKEMRQVLGDKVIDEIDVVVPVPETSNTSAAVLATELNKPYSNAFVKNRYVFRTFILPNQGLRKKSVRRKLSPIKCEFEGRNVLVVDDSLVRGTTSREIVQMIRECNAKKVIFASCSPAIAHQHIYGIDLADPAELAAHGRTTSQIAKYIQADHLVYLSLDGLKKACRDAAETDSHNKAHDAIKNGSKVEGTKISDFEVGVFTGEYVTGTPKGYFEHLSALRQQSKKRKAAAAGLTTVNLAEESSDGPVVVTSSGPYNASADGPEFREDISIHNFASESSNQERALNLAHRLCPPRTLISVRRKRKLEDPRGASITQNLTTVRGAPVDKPIFGLSYESSVDSARFTLNLQPSSLEHGRARGSQTHTHGNDPRPGSAAPVSAWPPPRPHPQSSLEMKLPRLR